MGKYEVGVLGNFDGKIGTVVGAKWKGIAYMRHKGRKSKKPPTASQLEHQAKFAVVTKFVHKIGKLLMDFYPETGKLTGINNAFAEIYDKALTGSYPAFELDYSKVLFSKGELHNGNNPTATAAGNGLLKFSWEDNTDGSMALADDKVILLAWCPELQQAMFIKDGAARNTGTASLNMINFAGKIVETWISFASANGKDVATSRYTGQVTLS